MAKRAATKAKARTKSKPKPTRRPPTYRQLLKSAKDLLPLVEA